MTAHLTTFQRALARRLRARGMSLRDIAREVGCSHSDIDVMLQGQARAARPDTWTPRQGHLTASEREEILLVFAAVSR